MKRVDLVGIVRGDVFEEHGQGKSVAAVAGRSVGQRGWRTDVNGLRGLNGTEGFQAFLHSGALDGGSFGFQPEENGVYEHEALVTAAAAPWQAAKDGF